MSLVQHLTNLVLAIEGFVLDSCIIEAAASLDFISV